MVDFTWNMSPNDRNSQVFEYRLKVQRKDGTLVEHAECDGTLQTVVDSRTCSVTMTSLLEADFYLSEGDSIKATIEALN